MLAYLALLLAAAGVPSTPHLLGPMSSSLLGAPGSDALDAEGLESDPRPPMHPERRPFPLGMTLLIASGVALAGCALAVGVAALDSEDERGSDVANVLLVVGGLMAISGLAWLIISLRG